MGQKIITRMCIIFLACFVLGYSHSITAQEVFPPGNLYVDTLTNTAVWDPPVVSVLPVETFEDDLFPPEGWSEITYADTGWHRVNESFLYGNPTPEGDGYYAVADRPTAMYWHGDDYLILPWVNLESDNYILNFDYYFNGTADAYLRFSFDGSSWEVLESYSPFGYWRNTDFHMGMFYPNHDSIKFAFHANFESFTQSLWAVDNVTITGGEADVDGYQIFLDGSIVDTVPHDQTSYHFEGLVEGQVYEVCVAALYEYGVSVSVCDQWVFRIINNLFERSTKSNINFFPNPATDFVTIIANYPIKSVRILNLKGQTIIVHKNPKDYAVKISTENLTSGVYLIKVETEAKVHSERVVIAR